MWILDDVVVKSDNVLHPENRFEIQTGHEIDFWEALREDKEYFAKVLTYGRTAQGLYWLAQKRYYPDSPQKLKKETYRTLSSLMKKYNLRDISLSHGYNWFQVDGKPLIYDWGI